MDLQESRKRIDEIDQQLLKLFLERMETVTHVATYKIENNLPVFQPEREKEIIQRMSNVAPEHLREYADKFFTNLMETSKCYQLKIVDPSLSYQFEDGSVLDSKKVACKGNRGSIPYLIAKDFLPNGTIDCCETFEQVFAMIESGKAECGILPIVRTDDRTLTDFYRLLEQHNCYINASYHAPLSVCLASKFAIPTDIISKVYSNQFLLEECSEFLETHPQMFHQAYQDSAFAAKYVSASDNNNIAVICSERCAKMYGLQILEHDIQNEFANTMEIMIFSKQLYQNKNCKKIGIGVEISNVSGELNKLLYKFSLYHHNIERIESTNIAKKASETIQVYLDFWGDMEDAQTVSLLKDLNYNYPSLKLIGYMECPTGK